MSAQVRQLEPNSVWNHFEDLNSVPRPSKKEEKVMAFLENFARGLDLPFERDAAGNMVIRKPATKGMEDRRPVIMQAHVDMVHQKNADTDFDFETEGIRTFIDGEWVKAEGTTLGADNGMGVAAIMAVLSSDTIVHPELEALFTVDEEAGMTGVQRLKANWLQGEILLNLDTEEDDEIGVGCAGGVDTDINWNYREEDFPGDHLAVELRVKGLTGGHSGMDIIEGRGNANKIMNRLILDLQHEMDVRVSSIDGGGLRNAIPRESRAVITVPGIEHNKMVSMLDLHTSKLQKEFSTTDPDLMIVYRDTDAPGKVMNAEDQHQLIYAIQCCHDGIRRMSPDVEDLVETSNNIARVEVKDSKVDIKCLSRSDRESAKWDMAYSVAAPFHLIGAEVVHSGSYPGWKLDPEAPILERMKSIYKNLFQEDPRVLACHAGLECGLLGQHYPNLEMISFGPTIRGAHSPDERVSIPSVKKFWKYLLTTLENIPVKKSPFGAGGFD